MLPLELSVSKTVPFLAIRLSDCLLLQTAEHTFRATVRNAWESLNQTPEATLANERIQSLAPPALRVSHR
eukprot:SAG22_NODE_1992_length_3194_cov_9.023910_3_plen_70_part_00